MTRTLPGAVRDVTDPGGPHAPATIVVVGPDGSGKSTVTDALEAHLGAGVEVVRLHGRARILPRVTTHDGPVLEPHRVAPYGTWLGMLKLAYLFVDAQLTWRLAIPLAHRRGAVVLVERGWLDIAVDPRRYRLADGRMARRLARLLPRPDLTVVLDAPAADIFARKPELPLAELDRQIQAWRRLLPSGRAVLRLDARRPVAALVADVGHRVEPARGAVVRSTVRPATQASSWVALPPAFTHPRWYIPRATRRLARQGLAVYHPLTRRAQVGWWLARTAAALGVTRLLPSARPPEDILALLAPHLGPDRHAAISTSRRTGRAHALLLDDAGTPVASVKVATDPLERDRLEHEAAMAEALGPLLERPLSCPTIVERGPGYLAFAPVAWVTDPRPWDLDPSVARAIGGLYRAGAREPGGPGFAHGDFVPWNILRTPGGWSVIDWEHARTDAPPFADLFRFVILSGAMLGRPSADDILSGLHGLGPLGPAFQAYADGAGVPLTESPARLADHLAAWFASPDAVTAERTELDMCGRLQRGLGSTAP